MEKNMFQALIRTALLCALAAASAAQAQVAPDLTLSVLYTFTGLGDGGFPTAGLVRDDEGNLYGTTSTGGDLSACTSNPGCGVVFKLSPGGTQTILHRFTGGADGAEFFNDSTLIRDAAGNLYGTTGAGGDLTGCNGFGCGVVFRVDPAGNETVLYTFTGGADGNAGGEATTLVRDEAGNLYGTTNAGGDLSVCNDGCGVVYKVDPAGRETVLHTFTGGADGGNPAFGPLVRDRAGNIYGVTGDTVFKLAPPAYSGGTWEETVLYTFTGGADGTNPLAGLIRDESGNLYGAAANGGSRGYGLVFKIEPAGEETVLYAFTGGADGADPYGRLIRGEKGEIYGTTLFGGNVNTAPCFGCGVVYKVDLAGKETVLHTFTGGADGGAPYAGLISDPKGNLYSTTNSGGLTGGCYGYGCGVVFKLTHSAAGSQRR
jgi:uncharacterized repeat protein (TIGR03803 family)